MKARRFWVRRKLGSTVKTGAGELEGVPPWVRAPQGRKQCSKKLLNVVNSIKKLEDKY